MNATQSKVIGFFFLRWVWSEAGSALQLEEAVGVGGFGYPVSGPHRVFPYVCTSFIQGIPPMCALHSYRVFPLYLLRVFPSMKCVCTMYHKFHFNILQAQIALNKRKKSYATLTGPFSEAGIQEFLR